jgi:hypothetical protein
MTTTYFCPFSTWSQAVKASGSGVDLFEGHELVEDADVGEEAQARVARRVLHGDEALGGGVELVAGREVDQGVAGEGAAHARIERGVLDAAVDEDLEVGPDIAGAGGGTASVRLASWTTRSMRTRAQEGMPLTMRMSWSMVTLCHGLDLLGPVT